MIRVLIVDDEPLVRSGLRAILGADDGIEIIGEAGDGDAALNAVALDAPDVVLMDVRMPRMDGIRATKAIVDTHPSTRVLVITTFSADEYVADALRVGAAGFLLKRAQPQQIIRAVHVIDAGDAVLFPEQVRTLVHGRGPAPGSQRLLARLTQRETEVLRALAAGSTNAEIAAQLWLGTETVKTHVGSVLAKLGARDRMQAAIFAYESGLSTADSGLADTSE